MCQHNQIIIVNLILSTMLHYYNIFTFQVRMRKISQRTLICHHQASSVLPKKSEAEKTIIMHTTTKDSVVTINLGNDITFQFMYI